MSKSVNDSVFSSASLQQIIENSALRYNEEKKIGKDLEKLVKSLEDQVQQAKALKTQTKDIEGLKKQHALLEKQVEDSLEQINAAQAENRELKQKVDSIRLESSKHKRIIGGLQSDLTSYTNLARTRSQSKLREVSLIDNKEKKIQQILSKSSLENTKSDEKITKLSTALQKEKLINIISMKKHSETLLRIEEHPSMSANAKTKFRVISESKTLMLASKKKELKSYTKRISKLKDGFSIIRNFSGLNNPYEVAEMFIASDEKISDLNAYLVRLTSEIDGLQLINSLSENKLLETNEKVNYRILKIHTEVTNELLIIKDKIRCLNSTSRTIETNLSKADSLANTMLARLTQAPPSKSEALSIKLGLIENILAALPLQRTPSPTRRLPMISQLNPPNNESLKSLLIQAAIPDTSDIQDCSPLSIISLKSRAKNLLSKLPSPIPLQRRSVSPMQPLKPI